MAGRAVALLAVMASLACAVALLAVIALSARPALEIRDLDDAGRHVATLPLASSGTFALVFIHSMYGGKVIENYEVVSERGGPIRLRRGPVRTETGGAAEYYARYGNFHEGPTDRDGRHGGWIVEVPPLLLERLPVRVDRTGDPQIGYGPHPVALLDLVPDGHTVELRPASLR